MHQSGHSRAHSMQTVQFSSSSAITPRVRGGSAGGTSGYCAVTARLVMVRSTMASPRANPEPGTPTPVSSGWCHRDQVLATVTLAPTVHRGTPSTNPDFPGNTCLGGSEGGACACTGGGRPAVTAADPAGPRRLRLSLAQLRYVAELAGTALP